MIQFNLLPDVKLEYIKATYRRRIISLFCFIIAGAFLTIFVLMFLFVRVNQTRHLSNLDKDINSKVATLRDENKDLDKILTIQNQLNTLPQLHDQKVISSRAFDYLTQVTPNQASVSSIQIDLEAKTFVLKGVADNLQTVNKFVDTLKFTDYKVKGDNAKEGKAFSSVVLANFKIDNTAAVNATPGSQSISFEIDFNYDEAIFANTAEDGKPLANAVTLTVPKIISTRSEIQKPASLFQENTEPPTEEGGTQ